MKFILKVISIILVTAMTLAAMSSCIVIEKIDGDGQIDKDGKIDGDENKDSGHVHNVRVRVENDNSEATCTKGTHEYRIEECTVCDKILSKQYVKLADALGHSFSEGICIRCGAGNGSDGLEVIKNEDGGYTVTGIGSCTDTHPVIEAYGDEPITAIADGAFEGCQKLKGVTIGTRVTQIGIDAFRGCKSLTSVEIGNSVVKIGTKAFAYCDLIESITIPDSVVSIDDMAFGFCYSLSEINFEGNLSELGREAFHSCDSLTSVELPEGLTRINAFTFRYCESLQSVTIPSSVTWVRSKPFDGCEALREIRYRGTEEDWRRIDFETELLERIVSFNAEY